MAEKINGFYWGYDSPRNKWSWYRVPSLRTGDDSEPVVSVVVGVDFTLALWGLFANWTWNCLDWKAHEKYHQFASEGKHWKTPQNGNYAKLP